MEYEITSVSNYNLMKLFLVDNKCLIDRIHENVDHMFE